MVKASVYYSSRDTEYLLDKSSKNAVSTKYSEVWTWKNRSAHFGCCSAQRVSGVQTKMDFGTPSDKWFRRFCLSVSQRRSIAISDAKATMEIGMKGGYKEEQTQVDFPYCFLRRWTSLNSEVHVHHGECWKEESQVRKICAWWICTSSENFSL